MARKRDSGAIRSANRGLGWISKGKFSRKKSEEEYYRISEKEEIALGENNSVREKNYSKGKITIVRKTSRKLGCVYERVWKQTYSLHAV